MQGVLVEVDHAVKFSCTSPVRPTILLSRIPLIILEESPRVKFSTNFGGQRSTATVQEILVTLIHATPYPSTQHVSVLALTSSTANKFHFSTAGSVSLPQTSR